MADGGTARTGSPDSIEPALRRVVGGFRAVAAVWVVVLAAFGITSEVVPLPVAVAASGLAVGWAVASVGVVAARRHFPPVLLGADVLVSAALLIPVLWLPTAPVHGAYPVSTILLAAWTRGRAAAFAVAGVLASAKVLADGRAGGRGAVDDVLFFVLAATVAVYGLEVLRQADQRRRAAEGALAAERAERIVADRLAETAAHLHDSVLQTLALIQRRSTQREVAGLAREQEHDLRAWLTAHRSGQGPVGQPEGFAAALRAAAADVERLHGTTVEVVTAGDASADTVAGLVAAAREAMANAARHSGADRVDVFGEVGRRGVTVWVRDRGRGFDPVAVPAGRSGLADSVVGRVERLGGRARIDTRPGRGTEVELTVPMPAAERAT